ncbi:cupin domain-containing protein [Sediminicurvatus halobius]|uniref:Mannose-6-phosphate isomerase n=1 Tax=Sediminicurvatus halobius TaxID=2182432 RepID=A0A2U2N364_9GAMM|nr:cupin domain-containing protein [Spiribacter halobius]PWG63533.1 mannose-6-phosphate isomerase [Spiribacter halobius]UEX79589.1 cupin domain-containing protein [Spiribacter halobius]
MQKVNLKEKLAGFTEQWSPRVVAELNGQHVRIVKVQGEFVWHQHEHEDELFLVIHGRLRIRLRDREVVLDEGELFVVPRGVEHQPVAEEEAHVLLFEPAATLNTGNVREERTVDRPARVYANRPVCRRIHVSYQPTQADFKAVMCGPCESLGAAVCP